MQLACQPVEPQLISSSVSKSHPERINRRTNVLNFREKSENPLQNMTTFRNSSHSVQLHLDVDYGAKSGSENIRNMYFEAFRPVDSEFDVGKKLGSRDVRISDLRRPAIYLLLLNAHPVQNAQPDGGI